MSRDYRAKCLNEKGERCEICEGGEDIVVHHVDGDRSNDSIENLVPLCRSCHSKVHQNADGYESWHDRLLPKRERSRRVALNMDSELSRDLAVVEETSPAKSSPEAVRYAVRERAAAVDGMREVFEAVDEIRLSAEETDAEVILRTLRYYRKMHEKVIPELMDRATDQGSVTAREIAEVLDVDELPVEYTEEWSYGRDG